MSKPAHKQDDPKKAPGQIKNDVTLGDYIERKSKSMEKRLEIQKKKLTFDEWWDKWDTDFVIQKIAAHIVWNAAQENK